MQSSCRNLADTRDRGALDSADFIVAMYLIQAAMSGALPTLPSTLPPGLYEQASGGVAAQSTGASAAGVPSASAATFQPMVSPAAASRALPRLATGGSQFSVIPSIPQQLTGQSTGARPPPPAIPPRAFPLAAAAPQLPWGVSAQEKAQSDVFFDQLDSQRTGFIGGEVAGPFLMESTLSDDVLAQVWDLVDTQGEGRLSRDQFAVVMHLINSKLAGNEVPATLPPNLVPPSHRAAAPSPFMNSAFQQQQQQFQPPPPVSQPQKDLFSMDDSPPPSAVQAPVMPQFSGTLSQQTTGQPLARQTTGSQHPSAFSSPTPSASSAFSQPTFAPQTTGFAQAPSGFAQATFPPPIPQHRPAPPPPAATALKDLLGDEDDAADAIAAQSNLHTAAEIGNVNIQLASTNRSLETVKQDREILQKEVESKASELAALQTQLAAAKASYESESKLLSDLKGRYAEQTQQIGTIRQELIEAESDLSAVKVEKTEVGGAALRDKDEVRALQKRAQEVADETTSLKAELEKTKKDARQQKGLLAIAKKQLATAEADRAKTMHELEETTVQLADDKKEVEDINAAIEKINAAAAVAPIPLASRFNTASPPPAEEAASIPLPATALSSPSQVTKSLNPFEKLARQDSVSGTPRSMSPFSTLPFAGATIPTPPIGHPAASPPPAASPKLSTIETVVQAEQPTSPAGNDPFGLDKFDEVFSTPTENFASPITHSPPPGLESFAATAIKTQEVPKAATPPPVQPPAEDDAASHFPPLDQVGNGDAVVEKKADDLPPLKELDIQDGDDTSSDEDEASGEFTHVIKSSDSDDWASAKEHAGGNAKPGNGTAAGAEPSFDDVFGEPVAPAAAAPKERGLSPPTSAASSPRPVSMLPPQSPPVNGAKDPFGAPQAFDAAPFEPPVGEQAPPPIVESVLVPSSPTADDVKLGPATATTPSGVSDFDEAMGRLPSPSGVQFSNNFDDAFDFGSTAFEPASSTTAPQAAAPASAMGFDDAFGLGSTTNGPSAFPAVTSPAATGPAPVTPSFDDVFGTTELAYAAPEAPAAATPTPTGQAFPAPVVTETPPATSNGHALSDSISTSETGAASANAHRPPSPATTGTGYSTPPRQSSPPPPPPAGISRSKSMLRPTSPKATKEKASKVKESPEGTTRTSKLSVSRAYCDHPPQRAHLVVSRLTVVLLWPEGQKEGQERKFEGPAAPRAAR